MSKKLIAVAAAAALALTGLVGVAPASATAPTITLDVTAFATGSQAGTSVALANTVPVPSTNVLTTTATPVTADTTRTVDLANLLVDDVITVTTTGAVKAINSVTGLGSASANWDVTSFGKTSITKTVTSAGSDAFQVFTTSTDVGTVTVKVVRTGTTVEKTYYIKGVAGLAYNLSVSGVPETLANTKKADFTWTVTDVFGNKVTTAATAANLTTGTATAPVVVLPSTVGFRTGASAYYNATSGVYEGTITSGSSSATVFEMVIDAAVDPGKQDPDVLGLPEAKNTFVAVINNPAAATANAAATAQIAALTAQLANSRPKETSVTKKKYNTLARKWNAAFPSQKVALKK
jgi:hypothetical protein